MARGNYFHWYMEKYDAQIELEESGECVRALEAAFSRMPIIRVIVPSHNKFVILSEFNYWLKTLNDKESLRRITGWASDHWWSDVLQPIEEGEGEALDASMDLISIAHRLGLKLDSSEFGIASCWIRIGVFDNNSALWGYTSLFQNITCLSLCITTTEWLKDLEGIEIVSKEGQLYKFLSIAQILRKLSLTIECVKIQQFLHLASPAFGERVFPLLDILGRDHAWKCLHTVSLKLPCMRLEEIVGFLGRHESTLKSLHLHLPILLNGTWRKLLDFLREQLHLTNFEIMTPGEILSPVGMSPAIVIYKADEQIRMKNYVLHEGVPFPFTKQELEENGLDISKT
ncbi:hypothetical protein RUND412_002143 [Rhizina undulata]